MSRITDFEFRNLTLTVTSKTGGVKVLLDNVSGRFLPGQLTAIIGPSGAGKSSLLNVLSGHRMAGVEGDILVNNESRNIDTFRKKSSYVQQNVDMLANITVLESLTYAGDLKLDASLKKFQKIGIIHDILDILKLTDNKDTKTQHLSGGELKRLSIGVELITNPQIMFYDEPTSGLDSNSALQLMLHLKQLAIDRIVVCVIHSPNSRVLSLFDGLYALANGRCFYSGTLDEMVTTFEHFGLECPSFYNRVDFAVEIAMTTDQAKLNEMVEMECQKYSSISSFQTEIRDAKRDNSQQYPISEVTQTVILAKRTMVYTRRQVLLSYLRLIVQIVTGFLLGVVFYDMGNDAAKITTNVSCIFFFLMVIYFCNAIPIVTTFPAEATIFAREHLNNWYSVRSYLASKMLAEAPFLLIPPVFFLSIAYYITGQPLESHRFLRLLAICLLFTVLSQSFGLLIGSLCQPEFGLTLVPLCSIPMLIFSGFFVPVQDLAMFWQPFAHLSFFRHAFGGAMQTIYGYERKALDCSEEFCMFKSAKKFLKFMKLENVDYGISVSAIVAAIVIVQILLYCSLRRRVMKIKL